jgi:hypothetical protein
MWDGPTRCYICLGAMVKKAWVQTTLNIVFNVTHYLELHDVVSINYISQILSKKILVGCLSIIEHSQLYLVKNYINNNKMALCKSK